nr:hypothetical protein CFP56_11492 [Quercus suber]
MATWGQIIVFETLELTSAYEHFGAAAVPNIPTDDVLAALSKQTCVEATPVSVLPSIDIACGTCAYGSAQCGRCASGCLIRTGVYYVSIPVMTCQMLADIATGVRYLMLGYASD